MGNKIKKLFSADVYRDSYCAYRCNISEYLKKNDPSITVLEIPETFDGAPVMGINSDAFKGAKYLKSVVLPESLEYIDSGAFCLCPELERVEFNSKLSFGNNVFNGCPKLPPETVAMGIVGSTDLTYPIFSWKLPDLTKQDPEVPCDCFRPDVFELQLNNGSFRECGIRSVLFAIISHNKPEIFQIAEQYGILYDPELIDELISCSTKNKKVECTAYFLELKNRISGFNGGGDFEL